MRFNFSHYLKRRLAIFLCGALTSCSSLTGWIVGDESESVDVSRSLASIEGEGDNTRSVEREIKQEIEAAVSEADLAAGMSPEEAANRGFRRNADPWQDTQRTGEGSLWNPDNQGNFYFSRNLIFNVGDLITVSFEPDISESLNSRISALYKPLTKATTRDVIAEEAGKAVGGKVASAASDAINNEAIGAALGDAAKDRAVSAISKKKRYFTTKEITLRVTEVNTRGVLKVEGIKKLLLKNASYDLKVAGLLREEDVGTGRRVASSSLMDAKFEVIK